MRYLVLLICGLFVLGGVVLATGCGQKEQAAQEETPAAAEEAAPEAMSEQDEVQAFDTPPEPVDQPAPEYPEAAKAAGVSGKTFVTVMIDAAGMVTDAQVTESSGDSTLDAAAVAAARMWTFKPATKEGNPVPSQIVLPIEFKLQ